MAGKPKRPCEHNNSIGYCLRPGTYQAGDKFYCWQHRRDEPFLTEKYAKARERRMAEYKKQQEELEAWDRAVARKALVAKTGIHELSDADVNKVIELGGIQELLKRAQEANAHV